ncbi:ADP-ribosylglycohydrolase family protein, partial [archaeon]
YVVCVRRGALVQIGETTHLAETTMICLRSLADKKAWDRADFLAKYEAAYGVGGSFVGYADHATKSVVLNLLQRGNELRALVAGAGFSTEEARFAAMRVVQGAVSGSTPSGASELAEAMSTALQAVPASAEDVARGATLAAAVSALLAAPVGGDDNQTPVLAVIVPIVVRYAGHPTLMHHLTEALRCISVNMDAITWSTYAARVLEAALLGANIKDAVTANLRHLDQPYRAVAEAAIHAAHEEADFVAVVARFKSSCLLSSAMPGALYLLMRQAAHPNFVTGIRENILAGGDSAGRGLFLAAVLGAVTGVGGDNGVPTPWLDRLVMSKELSALSKHLHVPLHGEVMTDHLEAHPSGMHSQRSWKE